jgi:phage tail P2-like protein
MLQPAEHLLPANASTLEKVFSATGQRIQVIPTPIDTVKRAYKTPAQFLPFAAWEYSVDVWFREWPQATKRNITARSLQLHQKKGTLYAISEYARYAGSAVLDVERSPIRVFSGPSLTVEQREAWLAKLPQVRVFLYQEPGQFGPAKAFYGGYQHARFYGKSFAVPSTVLQRLLRRARWVVSGAETDITVEEFGSYFRLRIPSIEGRGVFSNRVHAHRYFIPSSAWRRLVTIRPQARLSWRSPVSPTLQAVTSEPERVAVAGQAGYGVFSRRLARSYFIPSTAKHRLFDRYAVNDGTRQLRRPAVLFTGTKRYGFPAHTAHMRMSIPGKRSKWAAGGSALMVPRSRFYIPHDGSRVDTVRRAIQSAKRLSDRIMLDLGPQHRFVAGRPFIAGVDSFVVGRP